MSATMPAACANCSSALQGRFCSTCGQKATSAHVSVHDFAHDAWEELAHVDGKIVQTLGLLLFKPGALTVEFLRGRRVRYVSPLRLYLTCSVLFFALVAFQPRALQSVVSVTRTQTTDAGPTLRVGRPVERQQDEALKAKLGETLMHTLPRTMFVLMPFFGFLTWLFYRKMEPYYVAHLYYAIHFHAFVFAVFSIFVLCALTGQYGKTVGGLAVLAILPYHYLALKRVFGGSRLRTALAGTAIAVIYWITLGAVLIGNFVWVLKSS
jgi:hypothetical protein